jgi:transposase InsO family protein
VQLPWPLQEFARHASAQERYSNRSATFRYHKNVPSSIRHMRRTAMSQSGPLLPSRPALTPRLISRRSATGSGAGSNPAAEGRGDFALNAPFALIPASTTLRPQRQAFAAPRPKWRHLVEANMSAGRDVISRGNRTRCFSLSALPWPGARVVTRTIRISLALTSS